MAVRGPRWALAWRPSRARTWLAAAAAAWLAGAATGAGATHSLPPALAAPLHQGLSIYLGSLLAGQAAAPERAVWRAAALLDLRVAGLTWVGGLFTFGWAITLPVLFAEGFAQGFGVASVAAAAAPRLAVAAALPALAAGLILSGLGALALALAWRQVGARRGRASPIRRATLVAYALALAAAAALLAGAAALQAYGLAWAIRALA
jgi:hypothetical protein